MRIFEGEFFFRLKATLDISKPLFCWIPMDFSYHGHVEAKIRYEHLPYICYTCGRIGHAVNACSLHVAQPIRSSRPHHFSSKLYADSRINSRSARLVHLFLVPQGILMEYVVAAMLKSPLLIIGKRLQ